MFASEVSRRPLDTGECRQLIDFQIDMLPGAGCWADGGGGTGLTSFRGTTTRCAGIQSITPGDTERTPDHSHFTLH